MGTFTLGRLGISPTWDSGNVPDRWEVSGDTITFGGDLRGASLTETKFMRMQAVGLIDNPDVPIVPMTWSEDPLQWDCYVRPVDVKVGSVSTSLNGAGWFPAEFKLERVADTANAPIVEIRRLGALRANTHTVTNGTTAPWVGIPAAAYNLSFASTPSGPTNRAGADGNVAIWYTTDGTGLYDTTVQYQIPPGDFYDSAARFEVTGDTVNYFSIPGRQVFNAPTLWRLSNDLVRVTPSFGSGSFLLDVSHYDGSGWDTAKRFRLTTGVGASSVVGDPDTLVVLRNSPECCSIRLTAVAVVGNAFTLDLTLRRGARTVECYVAARQSGQVGIFCDTAEAATAHTSGVHATSADAAGNRYILTTPNAKTNDLTQGGFYMTSTAATFPFMISSEVPSATSAPNDFASIVNQYFAAINDVQRVAQR